MVNVVYNSTQAFTLTRFTVTPIQCPDTVTYAITRVISPLGTDMTARMAATASANLVPLDGIFNDQLTDGILSNTVPSSEYTNYVNSLTGTI